MMQRRDSANGLGRSALPVDALLDQFRRLQELAQGRSEHSTQVLPRSSEDCVPSQPSCRSVDDSSRSNSFCVFCKNNKAPKPVYQSHVAKDNRGLVVRPVLRQFNCPYCNNGGGDLAHTANFCPNKREDHLNSFLRKTRE